MPYDLSANKYRTNLISGAGTLSFVSIQRTQRNRRVKRDARIDTASILAFWPLRSLSPSRPLRALRASVRVQKTRVFYKKKPNPVGFLGSGVLLGFIGFFEQAGKK